MGDESSDAMYLDLNLGPIPEPEPELEPEPGSGSIFSEALNLNEMMEGPARRIREAVRLRVRQQRWRWRQLHIPPAARNISMEFNQLVANSGNVGSLLAGEGSVTAEERIVEESKACENNNGFLEEDDTDKKVDTEKGSGNDGSFYDCNICFDLAKDPVVTSCGHLFCWPCLYQWLHVFSDAKECPVCKGEVTIKNLIPIYGRGSNAHQPDEDSSLKIPVRPDASRVESLRQTIPRTERAFPMEEVILDMINQQNPNSDRGMAERPRLLTRMISSPVTMRGRREQIHLVPLPQNDIVDLTQSSTTSPGTWEPRCFQFGSSYRRLTPHRATVVSPLSSTLSSAERVVDSYIRIQPTGRNQEHASLVDDSRDSISSVGAVMNSGSQTVDTAVEIDSMVSLSTSSSRRRNDASRVSDVDSGDSHAPRRRRLH